MSEAMIRDEGRAAGEKRKAGAGGRLNNPRRVAAALALALLLAAGACERRARDAASATSYGAAEKDKGAQLFTVPAGQMQHVRLITVARTRIDRVLRLTGAVAYNSFETTPVISQIGGPVERILVSPGQVVRQHQPMLYVSSPDYAQARTNYLKARDALQLAGKNYARAQDLYAHHAIAEADLLQAESTRNQAQADLEAAEQSLKVLGVDTQALLKQAASPEIPVLAPIGGEVVERLVGPGQVLQAGQTQAFTISNLATVWVLANVYERDLGSVHMGDPVTITTDAYPESFHGAISYIAPALDPTSRTLQVRIVTQNPGERLKKDMYVTALVRAGAVETLAVPDAAILRTGENQPFVYVAAAESGAGEPAAGGNAGAAENPPHQFAQRLVTIGDSQGGNTEVSSGLKTGEQVVADGSIFLQFANSLQR